MIFPHLHYFNRVSTFFNREKLLYSLIFTMMVTALASPIHYDAKASQDRKGRDLAFVLDTSGSMGESGYSSEAPDLSKLGILKQMMRHFISERFDDNVGVTPFGTFAFSSVPLTYDMSAVSFLLQFLEVGIAGENTAIGDAIATATRLLKAGDAKNRVMILITDGYQNSGSTSIKDAVNMAKEAHIKIYTIGIGKARSFDAVLLKKIASDTGAKMFAAANAKQLSKVSKALDTLEPSPIHSRHYLNKQMLYFYPLALAMMLLLYILSNRGIKWSS